MFGLVAVLFVFLSINAFVPYLFYLWGLGLDIKNKNRALGREVDVELLQWLSSLITLHQRFEFENGFYSIGTSFNKLVVCARIQSS